MSAVKNVKNKTKRKFRRVLAVLLSVVLAAGLALTYSSDSVLRAEELSPDEVKEEIVETEKEEPKQEEPEKEEPAPAPEKQESSDSGNAGTQSGAPSESPKAQESTAPEADGQKGSGSTDSGASVTDGEISLNADDKEEEKKDDEEFWVVTFYDRDAQVHRKVEVKKGNAIGDKIPPAIPREDYYAYWAVGNIVPGGQGNEAKVTGERITGSFRPSSDTVIVPDYDKITHKVTFHESKGGPVIADGVRTAGPDTSYFLNDIPDVPEKEGAKGKWVYSGGDFNNKVSISKDTSVWAVYDQTKFTVEFMSDGKQYTKETYYSGDVLSLPADPVVKGKSFIGWFAGDTQYTGGEAVTSDLTITAKFSDKCTVSFVSEGEDGEKEHARFYRDKGETVGNLPQDPFRSGMKFTGWQDSETGEEITEGTVVNGNITAVAKYSSLDVYEITAEYYYINDRGSEVVFNTDFMEADESELPYTLTAPATIQTKASEVKGGPSYYPETPEVTLKKSDFTDGKAAVRIKYVQYTATYDFVYLLKDLDGNGYTEIERARGVQGVLNSYVTPAVKAYDYYTLEEAEGAEITRASGQELRVLYKRKNVQLTYETNGGSYVSSTSAPYGTTVSLPGSDPEREGYKFGGWYSDAGLTQKVTGSIKLNGNTTLYAKWTGDTVKYTVVYMFEKFDDNGTASSYVYDNSKTASATVGSTVSASSAASITKAGWEPDTAKNASSSTVIAADGSSVLKVYYRLKSYTFLFNAGKSGSYNVTADLTGLGVSGTGQLDYTMTVKLGQDISSAWPSNATGTYKKGGSWFSSGSTVTVAFNGWLNSSENVRYVTKRTNVTVDMLPKSGTSITYTAQWTTSAKTFTVHYWLQNADDDGYTDSKVYSQTYTSSSGNLSAKDIRGYTYDHGNSGASGVTEYNFYYNRDTYKIDYYYGSDLLDTKENVRFSANINKDSFNWTPTAAQCDVDSDYTFEGWYSDSGLTAEYGFDKMPASNLVLYAKWAAPKYQVSFVDGKDISSMLAEAQTVEKYKKAEKPANPEKAGYTFDGWYTEQEGGDLFDWNTQIKEDTTVYAHWAKKNIGYIVRYLDEEGRPVASDKEVTNPNLESGQEITETAIAVAGYRPREVSQTIVLADEDNLITFVYTSKAETTAYTVRYLIDNAEYQGDIPVAAEKTVEEVPGNTSSVVEHAATVDYGALYAAHPELEGIEFHPDSSSKTLVLTSEESQNILTFYYSGYKHADIKLHFVDMAGNSIAGDDVQRCKIGETFNLARTPIDGWELYKAVEGNSLSGSEASTQYRITEKTTKNGLEFTLFYQKKATVTALSAHKQYDGKVLTLPEAGSRVEGLLEGHSLKSVEYDYTDADKENGRLEAGTTVVTPKNAVIEGPSAEEYYKIRYVSGTLEVTKINVTVRIEPDRWTGAQYSGEEYKAGFTNPLKGKSDYVLISHEGYSEKYLNDIWDALKGKATYDESAVGLKYYGIAEKDAGDYAYSIDLTAADLPKDDNYSVALYVRPGRLQILAKNITVSTEGASKCYDGKALKEKGAEISGLTDADKDKVKISGTGSQTEVGTSENTYEIDWGGVKEKNYRIVNEALGVLTVTPGSIILTAPSASKVYDGKALKAEGKVSVSGLPEGFTIEAAASGSQKDAGTSANVVNDDYVIRNAKGEDVTSLFDLTKKIDGTLTVNKAPLTITTGAGSKAYDGKALTVKDADVKGLVNGETLKVTTDGSQTEVGTSFNTYSIEWGTAKAENYIITDNIGKLTVTDSDAEVVLTAPSASKTYDGKALKADGTGDKKVAASGLPEGFTVEATASGSQTNAGSSRNVVDPDYVIRNANGEDRTSRFKNIATVDGTLTVNKAPLVVTTGSGSKAYDGTALTVKDAEVSGLVNDEAVSIKASGSQTEVGQTYNTYSIDWRSAKQKNYEITENLGLLSVTENGAAVTLTAASGSKTYDGKALTKRSVTAGGFPEGFTVEATASGSQTDAGTSLNVVDDQYVIRNAEGQDRTRNFTNVNRVDGTLTVNKATLTITTGSASKEYDGKALTEDKAVVKGFVNDETAEVTATGSQTEAGTSDNTYSIKWDTAKQGNYEINETLGTLAVTENTSEITLKAASAEKEYDGKELSDNTVTAEGLPEGFTAAATAAGSQTDVGVSENTVEDGYVILNEDGEDRTSSFANISKKNGTLKVTPKAVTVHTGSAEKAYDGTALTNGEASIEGLIVGESVSLTATGSVTEVGSAENTCVITWDGAKEDNYKVTKELGTLTVTENDAEITLTAPSASKVYDGKALKADGTDENNKVIASGLPEGFTVEATASGVRKNAGESKNVVESGYVIRDKEGKDKTKNFTNVVTEDGTLTVIPKAVTISTGSASKPYDGTDLVSREVSVEGIVEGETFDIAATGSIKEVGSKENTYEITWAEEGNGFTAKEGNYTVTENLGTLTVVDSEVDVTLTAASASKTYDGTALVNSDVTAAGLPEGFTVEATATGKQKNAGSSANVVDDGYVIRNADGEDRTANFKNIQKIDGTLTVNPKQVTISTGSASKEYDGTRLTESSASVDGIVAGETYGLRAEGKITNVGSTTNTYTMEWAGTGSYTAKKGNYIVAEDLGTLTITTSSAAVVLTAASGNKVYDGEALTAPEVTATGLPEGFTVEATASGSQKDAGTSANTVEAKYVIRDKAGEDRTSSFANVTTADGLLTVTPRPVTIRTGSGTKEYDGTELKSEEAEITGLAEGENASVKATGSQTEVGESDNTYEISWGFLGLGFFIRPENYQITEELGKLKVTENSSEITLTAASAEKTYDGRELTDAGVTAEGLPEGFTVKATATGTQTEAGSSANTVNSGFHILNADGEERTSSFGNVKKADGTLTVNKRKVTLTSASDEKVYDGAALTNGKVEISGDGFADGEGASFRVTGAQREAGSSKNTFTYVLEDGTNKDNYEITEKEGDLTVTAVTDKVTVTVTEHSGSEKYDGRAKTVTGYDVSIDNGLYTRADFEFTGNDSVTGTDAGRYEMELSPEDFANRSKNFTDVEFVIRDGSLEISKRGVTLRSADDSKEYDGSDLMNDEITVGGDGFASGEGASYIVTGVQKIVGASDNAFTYALKAGTKEQNYIISTSFGALTVYGRADDAKYQVSVKAVSGKEKYDGKEHSVSGLIGADEDGSVKVTAGGHDYRITGLKASASGTNAGSYPVNITGDLSVKDEDGNDVTDQFLVDLIPGSLEITKRRVVLTSADATKEYDGNALTDETVEVTGDGFADGEGASYSVTGSQALTGFCANIFTYLLNEGTEAGNYDIKTVFGQLTVTSRDAKYGITLRPVSASDMYDGTDKTAEGFVSLNFMVEGNVYTVEGVSAGRTERHAGTYSVTVTGEPVVLDSNGNDVTDQFIVTAETGTLKIAKRSVTLTSGDGEKTYDGDALTNDEITVTGDGFAKGEGASYAVAGRQILPGSSENRFTYTLKEGTSADDYYITPVFGMLNVTNRTGEEKYEVTITANSGSAKYDGERHSVSGLVGADEDGSVKVAAGGHTYTVSGLTASAAGTDAGTYPVNIAGTASVTDEDGNDVTDQFAVSLVPGSLDITKRTVRLVSASATKEYDGEALTAKEVAVEGDGFAENEGATYSVTGRQKLTGSSANTFTYALRSGTKAGNYDITTAEGQLTVTNRDAKYEISVKASDASFTYDGKEKTASGLEGQNKEGVVTVTAGGNTYTIEGLTAEVKATDAGTYTSVAAGTPVVKDADGNDVTDQFAISPIPGTLTITKRSVTLTSPSDEKEYDGKVLRNDKIKVTGDGFAEGEGASYNVAGTRLLPGTSMNSFTYTLNEGTLEANYDITVRTGQLVIFDRDEERKFEVTLEANSGSAKYDGEAHTVEGFRKTSFTIGGVEYTVSGLNAKVTATDAGTYPVAINGSAIVTDAEGNDVTSQFKVKVTGAELTIGKRSVTMTSGSASHAYNGKPLTNDEITVTGDGFIEGEGAAYTVTGSRKLVGISENTFTYALNEGTKASNYDITTVFGSLKILNRDAKYEIILKPVSGSAMYDGKEHSVEGFETLEFTFDGSDYTVEGMTAGAAATDAGSYTVNATGAAIVKDASGNDVTDQFSVSSETGTLVIEKRSVVLTSGTSEKTYDGDVLRNDEITVTGDGFAKGEGASCDVTGSRLLPGADKNTFTYTLNEGTKADNYSIRRIFGSLTVLNRSGEEKYEVTITANSGDAKYDGERHSVSGLVGADEDGSVKVTAGGHTYTVSGLTASAFGTNAGAYPVNIVGTPTVTDESGNDVTEQFRVHLTSGSLEIAKRTVRLVSASATKEYDGDVLTAPEVAVEGDGFAENEGATYSVTGRQKLTGSSANTFTYALNEGTKSANYDITTAEGQLTVTNRDAKYEISVKASDASFTYDGEEKSVGGFDTLEFTAGGNTYTIEGLTAEVKGTDAGTYTSVATGTPVVKDADGNDVTDQFAISPIPGTLTITKRSVTLTSPSDEKEYDGKVLRNDEITVTGDGFAKGEGATYNVTGERTLPGTSVNSFTYTLNAGTKAENYDTTVKTGQLVIFDRDEERKFEVTLEANSGSAKYDGKAHTVEGFRKTSFNIGGVEYTVSGLNAKVTATDAGTYPVAINGSAVVTDADGNDVTSQFKVKVTGAELTIGKRSVTMTSGTASGTYDGKVLTNDEIEVTGDGFIEGEGAEYTVTGSRKLVGISENTFTYALNEGTKASNYDITTVFGSLTILNRDAKYEITLKPVSGSAMYDGKEHSVEGFETLEFTFEGSDYTVEGMTAGAAATDAGSYTVNATGAAIVKDASGNDVTDQFSVSSETGTLVIEKRSVVLTSGTTEKTYDGDVLTNDKITVTGDGFIEGEGASYDVTGSRLLPGADKNTFTYTLNEGTKADNYSIRRIFGSLTVLNRSGEEKYEVTITANSGSAKYDGERHSVSGLVGADEDGSVKVTAGGHTYTVSGLTASAFGTNAGAYPVNIIGTPTVTDESGNDVTEQFRVHLTSGSLDITKRTVRLVSASATKEYDGDVLTATEVAVEGDGFAENEGAAYSVTGRQKLTGSSANTFTYALNEGTKSANYDITTAEGQLTVTNRDAKYEISVKASDASFTYDGEEKSVGGFDTLEFTVGGNTYTIEGLTAEVKGTDAGTYTSVATGTPIVKDADGNDVTDQFAISPIPGTLTITKRSVTLTSPSDEKEYDGKVLRNDKITVTGDGFAKGEGASYNVTGERTLPGTSVNSFTYTLNEGTLEANYDITVKTGQLVIFDRDEERKFEVTLEANSGSFKYDGEAHTVEGFRKTSFNIGGVEYTVSGLTASVTATDAGTYPVAISGSAIVTDADGNDVTSQFKVKVTGAELTIGKRSVTMTSGSASHAYNGKPLTNDEITVTGDGFIEGEGAAYTVTGSRKLVGISENTFTYALNEGTKASNYDITTVFGSLTILNRDAKYEITLKPVSGSAMYDGKEHSVEGFETLEFTFDGSDYTVEGMTAGAAATDAGSYTINATGTALVRDESGNDVTDQFSVSSETGTLVIEKRSVVLTSGTSEKTYDGDVLRNDEITVTGDGFAKGEGASCDVTGSRLLPGADKNTFTYTLNEGTKADNYSIRRIFGSLKVLNRSGEEKYEVTITANSGDAKYDGERHSVSGLVGVDEDGSVKVMAGGHTYTVSGLTASAFGTNAGAYPVNIVGTPTVTDESGNDVTEQFRVHLTSGSLEIAKRTVRLVSASATKEYDGNVLTAPEVAVEGDGFAEGEGATYSVTGRQKLTGSSANTFTYALNEGTKSANYDITTAEGQLTVTNRDAKYEISVKASDASFTYDGEEKSVGGFDTLEFTAGGNTYTIEGLTAEVKATDAGTYTSVAAGTAVVRDADGNDVTDQFAISPIPGTLTITKRSVTLTSPSDEKEYDGKVLKNDKITVTGDGFAKGEGASYNVTGERTLPGTSVNSFTYTLNAGTKASNYDITVKTGQLVVFDRDEERKFEVTLEANSGSFKYDGEAHTVEGFRKTSFNIGGVEYTVSGLTASVTATDAGTYPVAINGSAIVTDADGNDVTKQFNVKVTGAELTIGKRSVTMTSGSATHAYNGKTLTNDEIEVTGDGFIEGEGAEYTVTGSRKLVGISDNTFTYTLNEGTKAENYDITTVFGSLTILNRDAKYEITLTPNGDTVLYDGKEHEVSGFASTTVEIDGENYEVSGLTAGASGTDAGTYDVSVAGTPMVTDESGNDVTDQFQVVVNDAVLVITPRRVTLKSADESREYDGKPMTGSGEVEITGDGFVKGEGVDITPTAVMTLVGATANTFDWTFSEGTKSGNYIVDVEYGTLSVVSRDAKYEIEMRANSDTVEYDGEEHSVTGFETSEFEIDGSRYTVTEVEAEATGTEAGVYGTEVYGSAIVTDEEGNDVTDQFAVSYVHGTLTITKAPDDNDDVNGVISDDGNEGGQGNGGSVNGGAGNEGGSGAGNDNVKKNEVPYTTARLGYWALFNLIMMILTVIGGLFMLVRRVRNKKDDEESESEEQTESRTDDDKDRKYQKRKLAVAAAVILAAGSVIAFFITEDLTNTMAYVDRYTWIMAVMLIGSVLSIVFGKKKVDDDDEPEDKETGSEA